MQVVDVGNAFSCQDRVFYCRQIDMGGRAFEQDVGRFTNQMPRTPDNQQPNQHAEERVRGVPARNSNHRAGHDRGCRSQCVAHDVQPGAAYV